MNKNIKSFLKGVGSTAFDIGGSKIKNPIKGSDSKRLASDWSKVGGDIKKAIGKFDERKSD